ncbi:hypothetical protein ACFL96_10880 [Thermoproteota archaeon]
MIGSIDHDCDIMVYLQPDEVGRLADSTLEGVLVKWNHPKRQGKLFLSVDDKRSMENGSGIGVDDNDYWGKKDDFEVKLFMATHWYKELKGRGIVGLRQRMLDGSKVHVYDVTKIETLQASGAEHLEFYVENRDRLPSEFE